MRQHHRLVSYRVGVVGGGDDYCLWCMPVVRRESQLCLIYRNVHILGHLYGDGHVRRRLSGQHYGVGSFIALWDFQRGG